MKKDYLFALKVVALLIYVYIITLGLYQGFTKPATELDSVMYHIPIAKSYLTGDIFSSPKSPVLHRFFPGAAEGILAFFLLFHIPLNLYNVCAMLSLGVVCYLLGKRAGLQSDLSVIFAASFSSLTAVTRWFDTQVVDIWFTVFYAGALFLLLRPKKKSSYFFLTGAMFGMILGTKYSGPFFAVILLILFGKGMLKNITFKNILLFFIPLSVFGFFWYLRNYLVMGNPLYPLAFLGLPGVANWALEEPVWKAAISYPFSMTSAFISEYLGWSLALFAVFKFRKFDINGKLLLLGLCNLGIYLFLPNGPSYTVHVSNLRYAIPVMLPFVLWVFMHANQNHKEMGLTLFALANMIFSLQFAYHPKLIFIYLIVLFFIRKRLLKKI